MRLLVALVLAGVPAVVFAGERGSSGLTHEVTVLHDRYVIGFTPGTVVRPEGDAQVADIPSATSNTELRLHIRFGALEADARPFMRTIDGRNGPNAVGLHYEIRLAPFACQDDEKLTWDIPWEHPCVTVGYVHRSEHNLDDGTYDWPVANGIEGRIRVLQSDHRKTESWLWIQWTPGAVETPFVLMEGTDIAARDLEHKEVVLGSSSRRRIADKGEIVSVSRLRFSKRGLASLGGTIAYLHDLSILVSGSGDTPFPLVLGIEVGAERNVRRVSEIGRDSASIGILLGFKL